MIPHLSSPFRTGAIGHHFIEKALSAGHNLTLLARTPSRLPDHIRTHPHVSIIEGDLSDSAALDRALNSGADVFISFAGPYYSTKGTPITDCYATFLPRLAAHNITRALVLSTPSFPAPADASSTFWSFSRLTMQLFAKHMMEEMQGVGRAAQGLPVKSVRWTVFRVGGLKDSEEEGKEVVATFLGSGKDTMGVTRKSVAEWVLREAGEERWVGGCPYICNP
ncbi:hypothetical protein SLS57_007995 [Botryosphaeria dothidea]